MLKDTSYSLRECNVNSLINALVMKNIHFDDANGVTRLISVGTQILVNQKQEVAHHQGNNFDISEDEYEVISADTEEDFGKVFAHLNCKIVLDEISLSIPKGNIIKVDLEEGIAYFENHKFDISPEEYQVVS